MLFKPPIFKANTELSGQVLQSSALVDDAGVSYADSSLASTRAETTRWFGTATFQHLYLAQLVTSGSDWGFGILPFDPVDHWVCTNTLRVSTDHRAFNLVGLILYVLACLLIITLVKLTDPFLRHITIESQNQTALKRSLSKPFVAYTQHGYLQLHRRVAESCFIHRVFKQKTFTVPTTDLDAPPPHYDNLDCINIEERDLTRSTGYLSPTIENSYTEPLDSLISVGFETRSKEIL